MTDHQEGTADVIPLFRNHPERLLAPRLRRPALSERFRYRLRLDLDGSVPQIWRALEIRSDVSLETVHKAIQAVFDWSDHHLYRFSLGGEPFDRQAEVFLCAVDVQEGEGEGAAVPDVRLDETLQQPGDVLHYVYDYGDHWGLTLTLEEALAAADNAPMVRCVGGERTAPPEDCGGVRDADGLASVLVADPSPFDLAAADAALHAPPFRLHRAGLPQRLEQLLLPVVTSGRWPQVVDGLLAATVRFSTADRAAAFAAHLWFLERAKDGIELTGAGYLKPALVKEAAAVVPTAADWPGTLIRESDTIPLLEFRESLQRLGLIRKDKGRLLLTKQGRAINGDPELLWNHLRSNLIPSKAGYHQDVVLLELAVLAGAPDSLPGKEVVELLNDLRYRHSDGTPIQLYDLYFEGNPIDILHNVTEQLSDWRSNPDITSPMASLAREALRARADR